MNHIPRAQASAELALMQEVVARHDLPPFVRGFHIELGDIEGDPAMWVVFHTADNEDLSEEMLRARVKARIALTDTVRRDLLETIDGPFPYFRFRPA